MIRGTKGEGILKLRFNFLRCGRDKSLGSICLLRIVVQGARDKAYAVFACRTNLERHDP